MVWALQGELVEWAMRAGKTKEGHDGHGPRAPVMARGWPAGPAASWRPRRVPATPTATVPAAPGGVCGMLWLNADGKRFMNEASVQQNMPSIMRQPKGVIAGITDANWAESVKNSATDHGLAQLRPPRLLLRAAGGHRQRRAREPRGLGVPQDDHRRAQPREGCGVPRPSRACWACWATRARHSDRPGRDRPLQPSCATPALTPTTARMSSS